MNIEKILSEAPEGATHYGAKYLRINNYGEWEYWYAGHWDYINQPSDIVRSLDDLREIQRLRAENEALKQISKRDLQQQIKALEDFVRPFSTEASAYLREEVGHRLKQLRAQLESQAAKE